MIEPPRLSGAAAFVAAVIGALVIAACAGDGGDASPPPASPTASPEGTSSAPQAELPLRVGVTLPLFADFVREMGGDNVEVFSILPLGADPHTYEPTPSDIRHISEADIIFVNDRKAGVEGSVLEVIETNKGEDTKVIPFMPNVRSPRADELGDPDISAAVAGDDPHLWLDPLLARVYANVVADTFTIEDGVNADFYHGNLADYSEQIFQMRDDLDDIVERIPPENRKLVTTHNAFAHLARRFGLELVGFLLPAPGRDASPSAIAELAETIKEEGVPAVFTEPQIEANNSLLEQIADDADVQVCTLYSDSLSEDVQTYIEMMRFNGDELLRCLGGEAAAADAADPG